jgi:replication factor A2
VEVKQWIDSEALTSDQMEVNDSVKPKLVENGYCRVWGRLKQFNNKRHVGAHAIRPITDYNEINYHLLEATAVHLFFTRGPVPNTAGGARNSAGAANEAERGAQELSSVSPLARRVYAVMRDSPPSNEGLHVQILASQLKVDAHDIQKAAEELVSVSLIFTTVDDSTWNILDYHTSY